jgi:hypothetical protein
MQRALIKSKQYFFAFADILKSWYSWALCHGIYQQIHAFMLLLEKKICFYDLWCTLNYDYMYLWSSFLLILLNILRVFLFFFYSSMNGQLFKTPIFHLMFSFYNAHIIGYTCNISLRFASRCAALQPRKTKLNNTHFRVKYICCQHFISVNYLIIFISYIKQNFILTICYSLCVLFDSVIPWETVNDDWTLNKNNYNVRFSVILFFNWYGFCFLFVEYLFECTAESRRCMLNNSNDISSNTDNHNDWYSSVVVMQLMTVTHN